MRYFTNVIINKLTNNKYKILSSSGRYHISKHQTPLDAAKKVFNNFKINLKKEFNFVILEITLNSKRSLYFYKGIKVKLDTPKILFFKKYNKKIIINNNNFVKAIDSKELGHSQVLRNWVEVIS